MEIEHEVDVKNNNQWQVILIICKMDQYAVRQQQIESIVQNRLNIASEKQQWNYEQEVGRILRSQPLKYQNVDQQNKIQFQDSQDLKSIIFDPLKYPEDMQLFTSTEWKLSTISQKPIKYPQIIPSYNYLKANSKVEPEIDNYYGVFQMQANIFAKSNELNFMKYHINLRSHTLVFYNDQGDGQKHLFFISLNQRTYDYTMDTAQFLTLRDQDRSIKIKKNKMSQLLITTLTLKLLKISFRGAYALRYQVPSWKIQNYLNGWVQKISMVDFVKQSHLSDISIHKYYRDSIGAFLALLSNQSQFRQTISADITFPQWLKLYFKKPPIVEAFLSTNVVPNLNPLLSLKIQVNQNEVSSFIHSLKSVFPYLKNHTKRSLLVYESRLVDKHVKTVLMQLNYPMSFLGFPKNDLSIISLENTIEVSGNLSIEELDFSYNSKLTQFEGRKAIDLCNSNPSLKKLVIKGSFLPEGQQEYILESIKNSLTLSSIQLEYSEWYNEALVSQMVGFNAIIE